MNDNRVVTSITLAEGVCAIEWFSAIADAREPGLVQTHQIEIPTEEPEFADQADALTGAAEALLAAALDHWEVAEPLVPKVAESFGLHVVEDDEANPYDNPLER